MGCGGVGWGGNSVVVAPEARPAWPRRPQLIACACAIVAGNCSVSCLLLQVAPLVVVCACGVHDLNRPTPPPNPCHRPRRRDLAIILLHSGDVPAARRELRAYMAAVNASANSGSVRAAAGGGAGGAGAAVGAGSSVGAGAGYWSGMGGPLGPDPFDLVLCRRLLVTLEGLGVGAGEEAEGLEAEPLSVEATLRLPPPWERAHGGGGGGQALPLTW